MWNANSLIHDLNSDRSAHLWHQQPLLNACLFLSFFLSFFLSHYIYIYIYIILLYLSIYLSIYVFWVIFAATVYFRVKSSFQKSNVMLTYSLFLFFTLTRLPHTSASQYTCMYMWKESMIGLFIALWPGVHQIMNCRPALLPFVVSYRGCGKFRISIRLHWNS